MLASLARYLGSACAARIWVSVSRPCVCFIHSHGRLATSRVRPSTLLDLGATRPTLGASALCTTATVFLQGWCRERRAYGQAAGVARAVCRRTTSTPGARRWATRVASAGRRTCSTLARRVSGVRSRERGMAPTWRGRRPSRIRCCGASLHSLEHPAEEGLAPMRARRVRGCDGVGAEGVDELYVVGLVDGQCPIG